MSRRRSDIMGLVGLLLGAVLMISGCGGGGGSSSDSSTNQPVQPPTISPTLGSWSGDNISFTLNQGSLLVDDLTVTYHGQITGPKCSGRIYDYDHKFTTDTSIQVIDNTFTFETPIPPGGTQPELKITGKFTSATTVEVDISWSTYNFICDAWEQGSEAYYAYHESALSYSIVNPYIQYRTFEDPNSNTYRVWLEFTKKGAPIGETDLDEIIMTDSAGNEVNPSDSGFVRYPNMSYDCSTAPCTTSGPLETSGVWGTFDNLPADTYTFEATMTDGEKVTATVIYPGKLVLPIVPSTTLLSKWSNGDLELSWANPTNDPNWNEVDQLRIIVFDANGSDVLYIKTDPVTEKVTIPASLVNQAAGLGSGALVRWEVQTRAYDTTSMNFARGISKPVALSNSINYAIINPYIQYRNYGDPAQNRYAAWIGVTKDGASVQSTDVIGFKITDSVGNAVTPTSSSFYRTSPSYYYYDCSTTPCSAPQTVIESGFSATLNNIPAGKYRFEVEAADGQKFAKDVIYPGQLVLPTVDSTTMRISLLGNGDWVLNWINPTGDANWSEVDQLRIILMAQDYTELLYIRANPSATTVIIPASLVSQAGNLGHGAIAWWQIQTRAYDDNNMMYARGYSH